MPIARQARLSILIVVSLALAGAAAAQRGSTANNGPGSLSASNPYGINATLREAMDSMQAKNYELAERKFLEVLQDKPTEPRANLMLGVTEMALMKWEEAKKYLTTAVAISPREPDPKSRLGVTLAKLGDLDGAAKQRADLATMDKACKGKCLNAKWIADGIVMIDGAVSAAKAAPAQ
ncbi:MAG: tetratricopeptide repeat protein [Alphaproteobacteria bacterium]